jgi:YVTN family beta-propeller protein
MASLSRPAPFGSVLLLTVAACGGGAGESTAVPSSAAVAPVTVDAVYVVNGGSHSISVIDAAKGAVIGTIELLHASFPHHVSLSADRSKMLVAVPGMDFSMGHHGGAAGVRGGVMMLDARTGATIAARRLDAMNHNALFSPSGAEIWTSQMTMPGAVLVLDPSSLATKVSIPVGDMPAEVTFSKDGARAFSANGMSNDVTVIDVAGQTPRATIPVGDNPVGAWPGADDVMYVDAEQGRTVTAIDARTLEVVRTYELGFTPGMALTNPSASELWVTNADAGRVAYYATTSTIKLGEFAVGAGAHGIAFAPDGKTAWITNQMANTVSVVDVSRHVVAGTIVVGDGPNGLVYRAIDRLEK